MSWLSSAIGAFTGSNQRKATDQGVAALNSSDQKAIDENARQFNVTMGNLQPGIDLGNKAGAAQGDILGLNGNDPQQAALTALQASPLYQSLYHNGEQAVLANGSATGGLRGGNTQNSLAHFGTDVLGQTIQSQLAHLSGLSGQGATTGSQLGALGAQNSSNIGSLIVNQGQNTAGGILGNAASTDSAWSRLFNFVGGSNIGGLTTGGSSGGGGGFNLASLFKGGGGNAGGQAAAQFAPDLAGLF